MDPGILIPTPDTIPAPWWVFSLLTAITFLIHMVLVDMVVGGAAFALLGRLMGKDSPAARLAHPTEAQLPTMLAFAINLGVAPLLFLQVTYGQMLYTSSVLMGVPWMLIVPLLIIGYYGVYVFKHNKSTRPTLALSSLAVSFVVFLFLSWAFTTNFALMQRPDSWSQYFETPNGNAWFFGDATLIPRLLHMLVAMVAVAGLGAPLMARLRKALGETGDLDIPWLETAGLKVFAWATALQLGIGLWFTGAQPKEILPMLMGQDLPLTLSFALGFLLAIGSVVTAFLQKFWPTVGLLSAVMVSMTALRSFLRDAKLRPYADPNNLIVEPQLFNTVAFVGLFIFGLVVAFFLTRGAFAPKEGEA